MSQTKPMEVATDKEKLLKERGLLPAGNIPKEPVERFIDYQDLKDELLAFANACEKIGMEKAAKISDAETVKHDEFCTCAEAIRAAI